MSGGVRGAGWWILLHLDRNRKAAASSVPSLNAKLHNADAGYYFVVHPFQYVFAVLLQGHFNYDPQMTFFWINIISVIPSKDISYLVIGGRQTLPLPQSRYPPQQ